MSVVVRKRDPSPSKKTARVLVTATNRCGHETSKECDAQHAESARRNIAARDCKACVAARVNAEKIEARERRAHKPRLPHESSFAAIYDAERVEWTGSLTVGEQTFTATRGAVFTLMRALDWEYRKSLRHDRGETAPAETEGHLKP